MCACVLGNSLVFLISTPLSLHLTPIKCFEHSLQWMRPRKSSGLSAGHHFGNTDLVKNFKMLAESKLSDRLPDRSRDHPLCDFKKFKANRCHELRWLRHHLLYISPQKYVYMYICICI